MESIETLKGLSIRSSVDKKTHQKDDDNHFELGLEAVRSSVVNTEEPENSPFANNKRSPDSFVRLVNAD